MSNPIVNRRITRAGAMLDEITESSEPSNLVMADRLARQICADENPLRMLAALLSELGKKPGEFRAAKVLPMAARLLAIQLV